MKKHKKNNSIQINTGCLTKGRINWNNTENMLPVYLAIKEYPFHAKVLAEKYNMSVAAVYYRLRQHGVSLTDLRNGKTGLGKEILNKYTAEKVSVTVMRDMDTVHDTFYSKKGIETHGKTKKRAAV